MALTMNIVSFLAVVILIVFFEVICVDVSNIRQGVPVVNNSYNAWPKLPNQQNNPSIASWGTATPWPPLGQQPNRNVPIWVRPNQRNNQNSNIMSPANNPTRMSFSNPTANTDYNSGPQMNRHQGSSPQSTLVSDDDLREFSEALLNKDVNNAAKFVTINFQGKTTSRSQADEAPQPLLSINQDAYKIPSIEKLMLLYNNYVLDSSMNEHYTAQEKTEENNLLDEILNTPIMQHTRNFLIQKEKIGRDPKEFRDILREIWFSMYSRGRGRIGSSGFEHVFLTEIKNNQISGLHNWIYFNEEEKKNEANYLGYLKKIDLGNKGAILKYHFTFQGIDKPVGSMFIGTSPELEMALYSTCFLLKADQVCPLKLNNNRFIIRTYTYRYRGKNMIGSAFPEI